MRFKRLNRLSIAGQYQYPAVWLPIIPLARGIIAPPCSAMYTHAFYLYIRAAFAIAPPSYCQPLILTSLNHFVVAFIAALRGYSTSVITFRHAVIIWLVSEHAHFWVEKTVASLHFADIWNLDIWDSISFKRLSLDKSLRGCIGAFFFSTSATCICRRLTHAGHSDPP